MRIPSRIHAALLAVCALFLSYAPLSLHAQEGTSTTTAGQNTPSAEAAQPGHVFITFVPERKGGFQTDSAQVSFGCSIPYPTATDTFSTRTVTWSGGISCSASVGLYGTTVFYNYNTNAILGFGNQINTTSSSASSSGSYSGVPTGTYQVNFNVDITPPAGYTTTPGNGCYYINGGPKVHCTVGSGTFSQP